MSETLTSRSPLFSGLVAAISLAMMQAASAHAGPAVNGSNVLHGVVFSVHDGDTVSMVDDYNVRHTIRLIGVDAPELAQRFGRESKSFVAGKVCHQRVQVISSGNDMYGRNLGEIMIGQVNLNEELVKQGWAVAYRVCRKKSGCLPTEQAAKYLPFESRAYQQRAGLWQDNEPVMPWDHRRVNKGRSGKTIDSCSVLVPR